MHLGIDRVAREIRSFGSRLIPIQLREGASKLQLMMRALLVERFKLAVHRETRQIPVYALVVARRDGRLGPELRRSDVDCAASAAAARRGVAPSSNPPAMREETHCAMAVGAGNLILGGRSVFQLANTLSNLVGRPVVDRTGLTGVFDITLTWTPDQVPQGPSTALEPPAVDPNGPSIFTALQEQLGLKLDSQKGPVDVLVIDRAEHPVED